MKRLCTRDIMKCSCHYTRMDWSRDDIQATSLQEVREWSTQSQQVVNRGSQTTLFVLGGPMPQHSTKTVDKSHTATSGVAIDTDRGTACSASTRVHRPVSASASRLLVPPSSPLWYPMLRRFRHSRYFAVCNAFVNPPAVFVCVGSLITVNFLSSCFA